MTFEIPETYIDENIHVAAGFVSPCPVPACCFHRTIIACAIAKRSIPVHIGHMPESVMLPN